MKRTNCAICDSSDLSYLYTLPNFPITQYSTDLSYSTDEFQNFIFVGCAICNSAQLQTLIDPIKLYANSNRLTDLTPTWKEHHRLFSKFVTDNNTSNSILEVGGSSGPLYKILRDSNINYIIMDIADSDKRPPEVEFIKGNCEEFDFTGHKTVVLSHTFEHLYSPRKFVKNLYNAKVESVFISIPNMDESSSSKNISIINYEHTYYIGYTTLTNLFSNFGYSCARSYEFKKHSWFYHFVYDRNVIPLPLNNSIVYTNTIQDIYLHYKTLLETITIDKPCFICPAGYYGQIIYYYLQRFTNYIKGFIDNDPLKHGKRVYGTPLSTFSPEILTKNMEETIYIILYAGPYTDEIKSQFNSIHPSIVYITI